jgi:hypothetical protein
MTDSDSISLIKSPLWIEKIVSSAFWKLDGVDHAVLIDGGRLWETRGFNDSLRVRWIFVAASVEIICRFSKCRLLSGVFFAHDIQLHALGGFDDCPCLVQIYIPRSVDIIYCLEAGEGEYGDELSRSHLRTGASEEKL